MIEVTAERRAVVERLSKDIVGSIASEELAFFPATLSTFFERGSAVRRSPRADDRLGFGLADVAELVSPVAIAVAISVVHHLTDETGKVVARRGIGAWRSLRQRLRRSPEAAGAESEVDLPQLSPEQEAEVAELARRRARELGLDDERTALLVAALLAAFRREP